MRVAFLCVLLGCLILPVSAQNEGSEGSGPDLAISAPELVLGGLDPVSLLDGREEKGLKDRARVYRGYEYRFASAAHLGAFDAEPDRYAVADDGNCPVAGVRLKREIKGKPGVFAAHSGRIYLFGNADARQVFLQDPQSFLAGGQMQPHAPEGSGSMQ